MMDFYDKLREIGLGDILSPATYSYPGFTNDNLLFNELDKIIANNSKVLIHGDPDVDGLCSLLVVRDSLRRLEHFNFDVFPYESRDHSVSSKAVSKAIYEKYDYLIIVDSSSNDLDNINKLIKFNVTPIILDHHRCNLDSYEDYPDGCIIISTYLENVIRGEKVFKLSAGALCFCLFAEYLSNRGLEWEDLSAYALCSLYSDCIEMTDYLNRGIYYLATGLPKYKIPRVINDFFIFYKTGCFNRRFIEYTFSPKINALFRSENFDLLNTLVLGDIPQSFKDKLLLAVDDIHSKSRTLISRVSDTIERKNLNNIVIGNLSTSEYAVSENKLYNYTGLVANTLSTEYGKPSIVLCDTGSYVKGSFRDLLSRDYLPMFKQFCNAEGHGAAFGIKLEYKEVEDFLYVLENFIDKRFNSLGVKEPLVFPYEGSLPDVKLLTDMATYNEFSGMSYPMALVTKKNNLKSKNSFAKNTRYIYEWGEYKIDSSTIIPPGGLLKIKPIFGSKLKLVVFNKNIML